MNKISDWSLVAERNLSFGIDSPTLLSDATMAGHSAGGSGALGGALGVIASVFISDAGETGSASEQGGLGTANPYNATDFPGQHRYAQCAPTKADGSAILLSDLVTEPPVNQGNQYVFGFLAYRSDQPANSKWHLWLYYRQSSDGALVSITPDLFLTNGCLWVPETFDIQLVPPGLNLGAV